MHDNLHPIGRDKEDTQQKHIMRGISDQINDSGKLKAIRNRTKMHQRSVQTEAQHLQISAETSKSPELGEVSLPKFRVKRAVDFQTLRLSDSEVFCQWRTAPLTRISPPNRASLHSPHFLKHGLKTCPQAFPLPPGGGGGVRPLRYLRQLGWARLGSAQRGAGAAPPHSHPPRSAPPPAAPARPPAARGAAPGAAASPRGQTRCAEPRSAARRRRQNRSPGRDELAQALRAAAAASPPLRPGERGSGRSPPTGAPDRWRNRSTATAAAARPRSLARPHGAGSRLRLRLLLPARRAPPRRRPQTGSAAGLWRGAAGNRRRSDWRAAGKAGRARRPLSARWTRPRGGPGPPGSPRVAPGYRQPVRAAPREPGGAVPEAAPGWPGRGAGAKWREKEEEAGGGGPGRPMAGVAAGSHRRSGSRWSGHPAGWPRGGGRRERIV
ncbi:uncharacterized protein ACIBXB_015118 [Morphnus guianensis]